MKPRPALQARAAHKARKAKGREAHRKAQIVTTFKPSWWAEARVPHKNNPFRAASVAAMLSHSNGVLPSDGDGIAECKDWSNP